jgi:hypothetical protein
MNIEEEKYYVALGMEQHGGEFVRKLGEALVYADIFNTQKIKNTWPDYWSRYFEIGKAIDKKEDILL